MSLSVHEDVRSSLASFHLGLLLRCWEAGKSWGETVLAKAGLNPLIGLGPISHTMRKTKELKRFRDFQKKIGDFLKGENLLVFVRSSDAPTIPVGSKLQFFQFD